MSLEETVNSAIRRKQQILVDRQQVGFDLYENIEKGKPAVEGETREWGGVKYRKQGKKWVPVTEKKTPPKKVDSKDKKGKKQEQPKGSGKSGMPEHMTSQHVGALKNIKKLTEQGKHSEAHDLADKLPDEVKNEIPSKVWDKMVESKTSTAKESQESDKPKSTDEDPENATPDQIIQEEDKGRLKRFVEKNRKMFDTGEHAHPERSKAAKILRAKAKGIVKGLKNEVHHIKDAGKALGNLARGKKIDAHGKHALKKVGISLGLTVGTMLATGGASIFHHGAMAFMKHLGIHFAEHALIETVGLASIFAKAVEEEMQKTGKEELSDKELDKILSKVVDIFIGYIESGDWSKLADQIESEGEEDGEETESGEE